MSGRGDAGGIVQTMVERATPVPGDVAAGTAIVRSVAAKLLSPLLAGHPGEKVAFSPSTRVHHPGGTPVHVIETGDQYVVLCNEGSVVIHC